MSLKTRAELKIEARNLLRTSQWPLLGALAVYAALTSMVSYTFVGLVLIGPLALGLNLFLLTVKREEKSDFNLLFSGFSHFMKALEAWFFQILWIVLWSLLLIVPGIIKALGYSLTWFIMNDKPELTAQQAMAESEKLMKGKRGRLFVLFLSFLGWSLLIPLTLGIILIWLAPYMAATMVGFYEDLKNQPTPEN